MFETRTISLNKIFHFCRSLCHHQQRALRWWEPTSNTHRNEYRSRYIPKLFQFIVYKCINLPSLVIVRSHQTMYITWLYWPIISWGVYIADRLHDMFTMFGFNVSMYNNQSRDEVMNVLECVQKEDHQDNGALVVCFLSHGSLNTISGSCGQDIGISNMTSLFRADNCPSMSGKPKFFILQACQGRETQNGR